MAFFLRCGGGEVMGVGGGGGDGDEVIMEEKNNSYREIQIRKETRDCGLFSLRAGGDGGGGRMGGGGGGCEGERGAWG